MELRFGSMQNSQTSNPYSYLEAGFNKFFDRSLNSNVRVNNLRQMSSTAGSRTINFDTYATSGSLGDKIQVGGIVIDGTNRRIVIKDETNTTDTGWIGNLETK